ncbi:hypothetical protein FD733_17895 [Pantoea sp. Eser]|nr:hypothetical protein [Pantoea sp. Eser]
MTRNLNLTMLKRISFYFKAKLPPEPALTHALQVFLSLRRDNFLTRIENARPELPPASISERRKVSTPFPAMSCSISQHYNLATHIDSLLFFTPFVLHSTLNCKNTTHVIEMEK